MSDRGVRVLLISGSLRAGSTNTAVLRTAQELAGDVVTATFNDGLASEYAGDMAGSLENLLDWTVGGIEIEGKPAAWINVSTSPGVAVGTDGIIRDPASRERVATVLHALADHASSSRRPTPS